MSRDTPDILLVSEEAPLAEDYWGDFYDYVTSPVRELGGEWPIPHAQHLSIVALGTYLRRHGIRPAAVDNIFRIPACRDKFRSLLAGGVPVVGISTAMLMEKEPVERIVREVRSLNPKAVVILGGASAERQADIRSLGDIVVKGDGERTLLDILRALKSGGDVRRIANLYYRDGGEMHDTGRAENITPDEIPPADWDLLDVRPSFFYAIEASKGCRYKCAFCSYPRLGEQTLKAPGLVMEELLRNRDRYGVRVQWFSDSNFTSWPEHTERLCDLMIENRFGVPWSCYARIDDFARRPSLARKMKEAGCVGVFSGIESGDDAVLLAMRKGYDVQTALEGMGRAKQAGLPVHGNFIIGFPGETAESVENTLNFVREAEPATVAFTVFWIPPGSEASVWTEKEHWGIRGEGTQWAHETMDRTQARRHLRRAMRMVLEEMPNTVIADEYLIVELLGYGLNLDEAVAYCCALRDYHRAKALGGPAESSRAVSGPSLKGAAEKCILKAHERIDRHLRGSCGAWETHAQSRYGTIGSFGTP